MKPQLFRALALAAISTLIGCTEQTTTNTSVKDTSATVASTPGATVDTSYRVADMGLTLPVLDALFYEEGFDNELKSQLQLSEEQITRLKNVSHESVAELSEEGLTDYQGSARIATQRSEEKIREIIGEEKTNQLFQLVARRYANGEVSGLMPTKPNAVPTDTRIVVNAAAYRMDVFQSGNLVKSYKVGIGYPEFPLPTGMRRAETIIFNPTWTPPNEPWVKGKFKPGQKVEAGSKDNPLGPIKIPIGAPSLIHGGKAVAKLGNFASHGCVGMTNQQVEDFAITLAQLSGSSLTPDEVKGYGKRKTETKTVKLSNPVPIELRYETIVAENGGLRVYRDVYERGTNTVEHARKVLDNFGVSYDGLPAPEKQALNQALAQMNRDAQGKPIVEDAAAGVTDSISVAGSADSGRKDGVAASKVARAKKGQETKTIKGQKEIMVAIAQLQGKGYPGPVNYNTGTNKPGDSTATTARR